MTGHKLYVYAISTVPKVVKESLDKAGLHLTDIKKVFIHQANEKMDEVILSNVFKLYGETGNVMDIMPMSISKLGNSSTATVPTLLDLVMPVARMLQSQVVPGCIALCALGLLLLLHKYWNRPPSHPNLPPGPPGNRLSVGPKYVISKLRSTNQIHQYSHIHSIVRQFNEWAKEYGPIFSFKNGRQRIVVLTTYQVSGELLPYTMEIIS